MSKTASKNGTNRISAVDIGSPPTNGAIDIIETSIPYIAKVELLGVADMLLHRWNVEAVASKSAAAKGSKSKKTDDIESYVYRDDEGVICIPGEYIRQSIIAAAKFEQDPRSPRKSACDLVKAAVVCLSPLCSLGIKTWDFEDKRRVQVQRAGITRCRPGIKAGWSFRCDFMVELPEYVSPVFLNKLLVNAGRIVGIADFRPTYGRFTLSEFKIENLS